MEKKILKKFMKKKLKNFGIKIQSDNISDNSSTMKCEIESIS